MDITRRKILKAGSAAGLGFAVPNFAFAARPSIGGHHPEPWFADSTLNLSKDLAAATSTGKYLALMWEQRGCSYCDDLHAVNFQEPEIIAFGKKHFHTIQMDLFGEREFIDFDGKKRTEEMTAKNHRVRTTPSTLFFRADGKEVFRMPGYAPPPLFLAVYEYVAEEGFKTASLQKWIKAKYSPK